MIKVTLKGYIREIKFDSAFSTICISQKGHPSDKFKVVIATDKIPEYGIREGFVIDCECCLYGRFPYNNLYLCAGFTARNFKELDEMNADNE